MDKAAAEWCRRCRSEDVVKGIDDSGDLCIKVHNVTKPWPHARPGWHPAYLIVSADPNKTPYETIIIDASKFTIGCIYIIAGVQGATLYNGEHVILVHIHEEVKEATVAMKSNWYPPQELGSVSSRCNKDCAPG